MSIRREDVLHVARLAELDVAEKDLPRLVEQMGRIVDFVAQLNEVPASEQAPAFLAGPTAVRLRADVLWAARRWQQAAEHIELLHGDRWKSFEPLSDAERQDLLRAGVAYAIAEDKIGSARLREKYAAKMAEGPDRRAFDVVTGGIGNNSAEFRAVARLVAATDTLTGFLRDLKASYPGMNSLLPEPEAKPAGEDKQ